VQPVSSNTQDSAIGENGGLPNLGHDAMSELERHDALNVDAASAARQDGLLSMDVDSNNLADFQRKSLALIFLLFPVNLT
jgi:hypothetical protein